MGSGTGVGLAVSRGIIDAHGGSITVEGPPQGGTTFRIKLPLTDPVRIAASDPMPERAAEPLRILIVEDEHDVRETLGDILTSESHNVELCASGADALQELAAGHFDLIISDLRMPGMDGLTLFREIEAHWPKLAQRVVFVTGDSLTPAIRRFLGDAGRPVIEKPFTPADVRGAVAEVTAGKRIHTTSPSARAQDD
jgi:two-component system NtrC family sensor kinase